MLIDVRVVPEGHSRIIQESRLEAFGGELPPTRRPVLCEAEVDRMGATIAVSVKFAGEFEQQCARCLESYGERVEGALKLIIKEERGRHGQSLDEDGVDFYFDVNHDLVDISPAIYDEIMIALPLKPLCSDDCKGIRFGNDDVDANESMVDPRWEALCALRT